MEKRFLPYNLSLLAKKKGFDDECFGYYEQQSKKLIIYANNLPLTEEQKKRPLLYKTSIKNSTLPVWAFAAPLYQDIDDWLINNHELSVEVTFWRKDFIIKIRKNGLDSHIDYKKNVFKNKRSALNLGIRIALKEVDT